MKKMKMPAVHVAALAATRPAAVIGNVKSEALQGEDLLRQVQNDLAKLNGDIKRTAENALNEAKRAGEVSAETKAAADQALQAQTALQNQMKDLTDTLEGVKASNLELSQAVASGVGGASGGARQTLGQAVLAQGGDQIKAFLANGAGGSVSVAVSNAITTAAGSGGGLIFPEEERDPVRMERRALRVVDLIGRGRVSTDVVKYVKQTLRTDATAAIAEQGTYPASAFGWTKAEAAVRKIGHIAHVSEETLADAVLLQSEIDSEMRYGLDLETEAQVLAGDGVGENLHGMIPQATAFAAAAGLPNATRIDRLRLAILQVVLADGMVDGILLNPTDWAGIDLEKDTANRYIHGNPAAMTAPRLWGKDVVESNSMSVGEWLVGHFEMAATLYDRGEAEVLISSEHGTNFIEDMLTMKARKRMALAVKRSARLVTGNFTFA